jgi:nucleotide-binding universal stress UspA family protein
MLFKLNMQNSSLSSIGRKSNSKLKTQNSLSEAAMFKKILVALDTSDYSKRIFEEAIALAKGINAEVMLLHVLTPFEEGYPTPAFPGADGVYPILHQEALDNYMSQLEEYEKKGMAFLQELTKTATEAGVQVEFSQNVGNPGKVICAIARSWDADLVIMGRRGRVGLSEFLLGSVSNYVTHHAPCSVLTVQGVTVEAPETPSPETAATAG